MSQSHQISYRSVEPFLSYGDLTVFSRPLQCNVRLLLRYVVCLSSVVCNTPVLWPNGFMDQDASWYGSRLWPKWHCITWGPSSTHQKGHSSPPQFFRPMPIVAKRLHESGCLVVCRYACMRCWVRLYSVHATLTLILRTEVLHLWWEQIAEHRVTGLCP